MTTSWKDRTITLNKDGEPVAKVSARKTDTLIYQWANDLLTEEELKGRKPEEYISQELGLNFTLPASALHHIAHGIQNLKKEHQSQIHDYGHAGVDKTNESLGMELNTSPKAQEVNEVPEQPVSKSSLIVRTPEEAISLCKIAFMIMFLLNGSNEKWGMNVLHLAGYSLEEINLQMERKRQQEAIELERLRNLMQKGY